MSIAERRSIEKTVLEDLGAHKMAFVAGPRQCGKTTFARKLIDQLGGAYFNWDVARDRKALTGGALEVAAPFWVFDEIHKRRDWRRFLKGAYDEHGRKTSILVTGSARLDLYGRGGDSLQGRYFMHRMHPYTLREAMGEKPPNNADEVVSLSSVEPKGAHEMLAGLFALSGFPEPLFSGSQRIADRWRLGYGTRLVREDVRDLERVRDLDHLELLFDRFPDLVGSPLSINSLRGDLEVAFATVKNYLLIFEKLYGIYRVSPFGTAKIKAVKKEQKLYLWDWARIEKDGPRFENMVMSHLLRFVHHMEDAWGEKAELRFVRDVVGHEADALILRKGKPWMLVEAKSGDDSSLDPNIRYLAERIDIPHLFQVSLRATEHRMKKLPNGQVAHLLPASKFLFQLP